jgi:Flp pilus assembly protein TadD
MKHNYKIYAKALVQALDLKDSEEKIISNFLNLLIKNNDLSQIKKLLIMLKNCYMKNQIKKRLQLRQQEIMRVY